MRFLVGPLAALAALALAGGSSQASPSGTQIVRWSPFDSSSHIKKTLRVKRVRTTGGCGELGPGSEVIGDFGYRCGFGNFLADPCWRDGIGGTGIIVCAGDPWTRRVALVRVPHFMLRVGVTFGRAPDFPWGIELLHRDRCTAAQGAHDSVKLAHGRRLSVDYYCRSGIVLLRNIRRTKPLWTIGSARYDTEHNRYQLLGRVAVRRVILGGLPPEMWRQNDIARRAAIAARGIVRRLAAQELRNPDVHVLRVRLALPAADWAYVHAFADEPRSNRLRDSSVVLHRIGDRWRWARKFRPYCRMLPARARRQLFAAVDCSRRR